MTHDGNCFNIITALSKEVYTQKLDSFRIFEPRNDILNFPNTFPSNFPLLRSQLTIFIFRYRRTMRVELRPEVMTRPRWPQAEVDIRSVRASAVGMAGAASIKIRMSLRFQEQSDFLRRPLANPLRNLLFASGSCVVPSSIPRESC